MRCAYQIAVSNCGYGPPSRNCPDCQARFNTFYTGDPGRQDRPDQQRHITSECLKRPLLVSHAAARSRFPRIAAASMVGHYCGVYVWVTARRARRVDQAHAGDSRLCRSRAAGATDEGVTYYVDDLGLPTLQKDAVGTVRATVAINERNEALINISAADELRIEQQLDARLKACVPGWLTFKRQAEPKGRKKSRGRATPPVAQRQFGRVAIARFN